MDSDTIVVELVVATDPKDMSLRDDVWSIALDQRVFGSGRLLVAGADPAGHLLGIAHTTTGDRVELRLACCLEHMFNSALVPATAVVFNDEPVEWGPPPDDLALRFKVASEVAADFGVHLVDWFACDGGSELFRSARLALHPGSEWWDLP